MPVKPVEELGDRQIRVAPARVRGVLLKDALPRLFGLTARGLKLLSCMPVDTIATVCSGE